MKSLIFIFLVILSSNVIPQDKSTTITSLNKITTNDDYEYIAVNQMKMWISNNGMGSHNPVTNNSGLFWPGGNQAALPIVFADGLICGGKINGETIVTGNYYNAGLQAGKILDTGIPDSPEIEKYRVFKIFKNWQELPPGETRNKYEKDFIEWPTNDGAPWFDVDENGIYNPSIDQPKFEGDEVLWFVSNDLDTTRIMSIFNNSPIGLEFQVSTYGFANSDELGNTLFKKYKIINKGQNKIDSMYFGLFSDPDVGNADDDYIGCDTILNLAYAYNADNYDEGYYGSNPPVIGYKLVQGLKIKSIDTDSAKYSGKWIKGYKNLSMNSFTFFINGTSDSIFRCDDQTLINRIPLYNLICGKACDGEAYIDPYTDTVVKFPFPGDPAINSGWTMLSHPDYQQFILRGDKKMFLNSGPFTMEPSDTQEVVVAIIAAIGANNIQGITELKNAAAMVQTFYDLYTPEMLDIKYQPPIPDFYYLSQNYPNPFNPNTKISWQSPVAGNQSLKVYDVLGNEVATLVNEFKNAGTYEVNFNASKLSSGVYFYQLKSGDFLETRKMVLIK